MVSLIILVYALLSLGRNIGFIPAQRKVVTKGAYGLVRHPIYTGTFVSLFAFVLRSYSVLNLTMALVLIALLMVRGVVEERFLRENPGYAAYLQEVRWRWSPHHYSRKASNGTILIGDFFESGRLSYSSEGVTREKKSQSERENCYRRSAAYRMPASFLRTSTISESSASACAQSLSAAVSSFRTVGASPLCSATIAAM
jgi:Phospholipid methyltransferase